MHTAARPHHRSAGSGRRARAPWLPLALTALAGLAASSAGAQVTWQVTTTADDLPPGTTCQPQHQCLTLRDAIYSASDGDTITFNLAGVTLPAKIQLQNAAALDFANKSITIQGPGWANLTIQGGGNRVFLLPDDPAGTSVAAVSDLRIAGGVVSGTQGADGADATLAGAAGADGHSGTTAYGGCIYVGHGNRLTLTHAVVETCFALGGKGGAGGNGAAGTQGASGNTGNRDGGPGGAGGRGGNGGSGGGGMGGAIASFGELDLVGTTVRNNYANGGAGGDAGAGGNGGTGGDGLGAPCTPQPSGPCIPQGGGGNGGAGGNGGDGGTGGSQGWGAGGAIYAPGGFSATNSTLVDNTAMDGLSFAGPVTGGKGGSRGSGGDGGHGGSGVPQGTAGATGEVGTGGVGGHGGTAEGGAVFNYNTATQNVIKHTTIAFNYVRAGAPGPGANGSSAGTNGWASGAGVENQNGAKITFWNSIVSDNQAVETAGQHHASNCNLLSPAVLNNDNLGNDTSCGAFTVASATLFAPPQNGGHAYPWGGNGMPVVMPLPGSPAIDGAKVHGSFGGGLGGCSTLVDERGVARPHLFLDAPVACDLGAVQSDLIFRDGFDVTP